jgi:hypothetical protein
MLLFFDSCLLHQAFFLSLIGIGSKQPLITMARQQQHQLLGGISFQIDNMTFSHHLASFNGIQMQNAESLPHLKMMQAIELLGTRVAPALRKELGGDK